MPNSTEEILGPTLDTPADLKKEATRRRKTHDTVSVRPAEVEEYLQAGWEFDKKLQVKHRLKRPKRHDERHENKVWLLLQMLGYPEMNEGRNFTVSIERHRAEPIRKQIDVFACDDETVVVVECKSAERLRKTSLQKDIEEFGNLKGPIAKAVRKYYRSDFKPKIIWLFVTENIIWSKPDRERAVGQNIQVVTERELRYYYQIAEHLGPAARYQFLAQFLQGQKIPELGGFVVPALRGKLGGKPFFSFVITPGHLLKVAFVNHRSLNDPEGAPTYQRLVSRLRMRQIGKFLQDGGFFPTNILVNFIQKPRFDTVKKDQTTGVTFGYLHLPDKYRSVWVIDGQHRLYGYAHLEDSYLRHNLAVIAFAGLPTEEEANLFVTINHEQKTVAKTLLDDLEGELKWGSDVPSERIGAIAARLINILNLDVGEPFYNRVTQQGITATNRTCITIPAMKDGLRRSGLLGRAILKHKVYERGPFSSATDAGTLDRARSAINQFFTLVRSSNERQWDRGRGGFLCTNVAIQAYLQLLSSLIKYMEANTGFDSKELEAEEIIMEIEPFAQSVLDFIREESDLEIERRFKVPFGSGGPPEFYYRLCAIVKETHNDFVPDGMEEWVAEQSEEKVTTAERKLKRLEIKVKKYVFALLERKYGTANDAYWHKGVTDKSVKTAAYERSLDDDTEDRLPLENYLMFIDLKKIVANKDHWSMFKEALDIAEHDDKGRQKNLQWMDRINELRRITAHPSDRRRFKAEDFDYIDFIFDEIDPRLDSIDIEAVDVGGQT